MNADRLLMARRNAGQKGAPLVPIAGGELARVQEPVQLVEEPSMRVDRALGELTDLTVQQPALDEARQLNGKNRAVRFGEKRRSLWYFGRRPVQVGGRRNAKEGLSLALNCRSG
jgi:hypothetical protein